MASLWNVAVIIFDDMIAVMNINKGFHSQGIVY